MDLRQAAAQFDLDGARRFPSLSEAEPVCGQRTGFLLEVDGGGDHEAQPDEPASVLFVERLRG